MLRCRARLERRGWLYRGSGHLAPTHAQGQEWGPGLSGLWAVIPSSRAPAARGQDGARTTSARCTYTDTLSGMRRTPTTLEVARELVTEPIRSHWSYELSQTLTRKLGRNVSRGTVYPILLRMKANGWVRDYWSGELSTGGPPRHCYIVTETGKQELSALVRPPSEELIETAC